MESVRIKKYMRKVYEDWDGDIGEKLNGNKWEKIEEDKMGFGGQWMDEPPYRKPSNFKAFWRFE